MSIGIGVDTGGTYTDAVMYEFESRRILSCAKALTTKDDLSVGIGNALDGLPPDLLGTAELIALSTTLATNAAVENKGGRAKLLFIGVDRRVVEWVGRDYGLPGAETMFFLDARSDARGDVIQEPDWSSFLAAGKDWMRDAGAVGVVEIDAMDNSAVLEKKARDLIAERYAGPVVCGHELSSDLNSLTRGSGVLLNAKLVPLITDFLRATKRALDARGIAAPIVIVRSDGSLMSREFAMRRPVETLLCGPAASAMGGLALSKERDCLIVDMGGTTTDIAIVRGGVPRRAKEGIRVGTWSTFVRGLSVDTFGLGGDSAVRLNDGGHVALLPIRLIPLSVAAEKWPVIVRKLRLLVDARKKHSLPLHEFFCPVKDISGDASYDEREMRFCRALRDAPLSLTDAAQALGTDIYNLDVHRLEEEGVVMRCGLTPTDIMHIKGDYIHGDVEAARLGAQFVASCAAMTPDELSGLVYDAVKKTLYRNIVGVLLEDASPSLAPGDRGDRLGALVSESWELSKNGSQPHFLRFGFQTPAALVGIGAPVHIFLPDVARALHARCIVPENAGVANALGAILGNITATREVVIKPEYAMDGIRGYIVFGGNRNIRCSGQAEALEIAQREAEAAAREEAVRRGASGHVTVHARPAIRAAKAKDGTDVLIDLRVAATAVGRVAFGSPGHVVG